MADGDLLLPASTSEAEVSAYEDNVSSLVQEILDNVQDPATDSNKVVRVLNRGLREMVATLAQQNVWLPSLATTGYAVARSDSLDCRLPANFHGNLHRVVDLVNGSVMQIVDWSAMQDMMDSGLPGSLHSVCLYGGVLKYWHAPDNDHRLGLSYFAFPPRLALTSRATSLPPELSSSLLVNYGLWKLYEEMETEQNDGRANTKYYMGLYNEQLLMVVRNIQAFPGAVVQPVDFMGVQQW